MYGTSQINSFHSSTPYKVYSLKGFGEYNYLRSCNSLGFADKEWSLDKKEETIRIICLGDSFTEGDGAHVDSSYVRFLERSLKKKYDNIEVLNAGKCGSDPFYNFESLKKLLIDYKPDLVIQSFTTNDYYYDFLIYGGKERFVNDTTLQFRKDYWWEPIYAASYISRILIQTLGGYDKYLIKENEYSQIYADLEKQSIELFKEYNKLSIDKNFDLIVFNIPFKENPNSEYIEFQDKFNPLFASFELEFYDLNNCYDQYIKTKNKKRKDFYWVKDGHHNAQGYEMMAKCLEEIVTPVIEKRIANENSLVN